MRIAYEAAAETAKSAEDSSKPVKDVVDEASKERPWAKLDGIFARWGEQREAAMKAAAKKQEAGAMEAKALFSNTHDFRQTALLVLSRRLRQLNGLPFPDQLVGNIASKGGLWHGQHPCMSTALMAPPVRVETQMLKWMRWCCRCD